MRVTLLRHVTLASVLGLLLLDGSAIAQTRPAPDAKAWVQRHDKNGDGRIDREEFHQAVVEAFFFRDKDKSGYLTIVELEGASPEAVKAASRNGEGRLTLQEFVNAVFKDFEAADTNHDGLLTVEEIEIYIRSAR
jgi:Ca2+-binding EF-hand superfamily protein